MCRSNRKEQNTARAKRSHYPAPPPARPATQDSSTSAQPQQHAGARQQPPPSGPASTLTAARWASRAMAEERRHTGHAQQRSGQRAEARDPAAAPKGFKGFETACLGGMGLRPAPRRPRPTAGRRVTASQPAADGGPLLGKGILGSTPSHTTSRALNWAPPSGQAVHPLPPLPPRGRPHQKSPPGPSTGPHSQGGGLVALDRAAASPSLSTLGPSTGPLSRATHTARARPSQAQESGSRLPKTPPPSRVPLPNRRLTSW